MAKGYLKLMMLKIISDGDATGYQIIKRVEETVGSKPSTGSVYPLLKTMEKDGWIEGSSMDGKTVYTVTEAGIDQLDAYKDHKIDHMMRLHQSITMAAETLDEPGRLVLMEQLEIVHPLLEEIMDAEHRGVSEDDINEVLEMARKAISDLEGGG